MHSVFRLTQPDECRSLGNRIADAPETRISKHYTMTNQPKDQPLPLNGESPENSPGSKTGSTTDQLNFIKSIMAAQRDGRQGRALRDCRKAMNRWPEEPRFLLMAVGILLDKGDQAEALPLLQSAASLIPEDANVHASIGEIQRAAGRYNAALAAYDDAIENGHHQSEVLQRHRGEILARLGRPDEAIEAFRLSLSLDDGHAQTWFELGVAAQRIGNREMALDSYDHAIAANPDHGQSHRMRANLVRFTANDPSISAMSEALARAEKPAEGVDEPNLRRAMHIGFGLAKAYDDVGDVDRSFAALALANDRKRASLDYDVANDEDLARRIKKFFNHDNLVRLHGAGVSSDKPVFVVGMPRSGTTLIEQILASHSGVHGAGEIPYLMRIALSPRKDVAAHRVRNNTAYRGSSYLSMANTEPADVPFPEYIHDIKPEGLAFRATAYLDVLDKIAPDARRVVDKTPVSFMFAGFIRMAFPQARIINCVRDPMDTCFSCYKRHFAAGPSFAYNLEDLGRYYRLYVDLMDHWRTIMPETIFDLVYEDMVGDFETHARRLVDFVGLDWEDTCLDFHRTDRVIDTASNMQVRQPLNDQSIGAWRKYAQHLRPLEDALNKT